MNHVERSSGKLLSVLTLLEVLNVAGSEGDADLVDLGSRGRSIDILILGDVAHLGYSKMGCEGLTVMKTSGDQGILDYCSTRRGRRIWCGIRQ